MVKEFWHDLEKGRRGEYIVAKHLAEMNPDKQVEWVGDEKEYYHIGDIKMTDNQGNVSYFEVKNDGWINRTHNVLCEEEVYYTNQVKKGYMYCDYTNFCVVDEVGKLIYLIDFDVLKKIYKKVGENRLIRFSDQATDAYLVSLEDIKAAGGLKAIASY